MRKNHFPESWSATRFFFWASLFAVACAGAAFAADGAIPITTASEEARELFIRGRWLVENYREADGAKLLEQALAKDPDFALAYLWHGKALRNRDDLEKALELADRVSEGERLTIYIEQARSSREASRVSELYDSLLEKYPDDPRIRTELGIRDIGLREYAAAVEHLQRAVAADPDYPPAYNALGYGYRYLGQLDRAETNFRKYIELLPDEPNAYHSYGQFLLEVGRLGDALPMLEKAIALDPGFFRAYIDIGSCYVWQDQHEKAREKYRELAEYQAKNGQRADVFDAVAFSYVDEGRYDEALKTLDEPFAEAEKENRQFEMIQNRIISGRILLHAGLPDEALRRFRRAVALAELSGMPPPAKDREWREFVYFESRVALTKGDLSLARTKAQRYRELVEEAGDANGVRLAHELAGRIALAEKDYDLAIAELDQSDLRNADNWIYLGDAHLAKADRDSARKNYETAATINRSNNFMFAFARKQAKRKLAELE